MYSIAFNSVAESRLVGSRLRSGLEAQKEAATEWLNYNEKAESTAKHQSLIFNLGYLKYLV